LEKAAAQNDAPVGQSGGKIEMEEKFCSVALDIIGLSVFNYEFGSVADESPVIKAVYSALVHAEHMSMTPAPYWDLPFANQLVPRLREFNANLKTLDEVLTDLIDRAKSSRQVEDIEELENRDYANVKDPSLLRFLVDMRGADIDNKQLRDDLMTMLIAGHETTAAMLTWTLFELTQGDPEMVKEIQNEVRTVLKGKDRPDYEDIVEMKKLRYSLIEALRLYPEPPLLIRRARTEDSLPPGGTGLKDGVKILRGTDIFISTWNLHRSPELWENPEKFDPTRYERPFKNMGVKGWEGFDPEKVNGIYPSENSADFAFLPFGGGQRRCIGDQFAMLEAAVTMVRSFVLLLFESKS
jgi:cytochrome P450